MRIGLFGGTFNPIHNGHLRVAKEVKEDFPLDHIIFFPSATPPHKDTTGVASADSRLHMLHIALSEDPDFSQSFSISDVELKRQGPSYTIDTVHQYQSNAAKDEQFYFILGMDAFFEIDTWKSYLDLFDIIPFIIMSRPGTDAHTNGTILQALEIFIQKNISSGYKYVAKENKFIHPGKKPIYMFDVTPIGISATQIRNQLENDQPVQSLLPQGVEDYIKSKGLYT